MRRSSPPFASSPRFAAAALGGFLVGICAIPATAAAAEPGAIAPASVTSSTQVTAPAGNPVVVVSTTVPAPAPAPVVVAAPAAVATPAPASAPVADPSWGTPVQPAAPVAVAPRLAVDLYSQPMATPSREQLDYSRRMADVSRARNLRIGGWVTLGSTYVLSALIGTIAIDTGSDRIRSYGAWMLVPVAGPFGAAFQTRSATGALLTTTLGVAQAAGLGMAIVGGARHRRLKRELTLTAMPTHGGGHVGFSMRF